MQAALASRDVLEAVIDEGNLADRHKDSAGRRHRPATQLQTQSPPQGSTLASLSGNQAAGTALQARCMTKAATGLC